MRRALVPALLLIAVVPAHAQHEDAATQDYEEQDRRYLERLQRTRQERVGISPISDPTAAFLEVAEKLVRDRNYASARTARYFVQSDDPRLDAEATAAFLETFRDYFDTFWDERFELGAYDKTSRVFLFYSFYKYNQLLAGDFRFSAQRPQGHYGSLYDVISLHSDGDGGPGATPDALIHEATHQLVDQRIFGGHPPPIYWLTEGLAGYFGYTLFDAKGGFREGAIGGKTVPMFRGARTQPGEEPKLLLRESGKAFRAYAKTHDAPLVEQLLAIDSPARFYGENRQLNYSASWLLVHLLFHAEEGRYQEAFLRYLERAVAGEGAPQALLDELELDASELQAALQRHAKTLKAR